MPLLISEPFVQMLSPAAARYIRQVDRIKKPGEDPIGMYTYDSDIWIDWQRIDEERSNQLKRQVTRAKKLAEAAAAKGSPMSSLRGREAGKGQSTETATEPKDSARKHLIGAPDVVVWPYQEDVWDDDEDLVQLRHHVDSKFREIWKGGIEAYIEGYWDKARKNFNLTLELSNGKDGPSKFLLERIAEDGPEAPKHWPGYRMEGGGH